MPLSRPTFIVYQMLDTHLTDLAAHQIGTRFITRNTHNAMFVAEKLGIVVSPTLVGIVDGATMD